MKKQNFFNVCVSAGLSGDKSALNMQIAVDRIAQAEIQLKKAKIELELARCQLEKLKGNVRTIE